MAAQATLYEAGMAMDSLLKAVDNDDVETVLAVLGDESLDWQDRDGRTTLVWAIIKGSLSVVQGLLSRGANLRIHDKYGLSTLDWAWMRSQPEAAVMLLDAGADVTDANFGPILVWAAREGHLDLLRLALAKGEDINCRAKYTGNTPLIEAVMNNQVEASMLLLGAGADPKWENWDNQSALLWARANQLEAVVSEIVSSVDNPH